MTVEASERIWVDYRLSAYVKPEETVDTPDSAYSYSRRVHAGENKASNNLTDSMAVIRSDSDRAELRTSCGHSLCCIRHCSRVIVSPSFVLATCYWRFSCISTDFTKGGGSIKEEKVLSDYSDSYESILMILLILYYFLNQQ